MTGSTRGFVMPADRSVDVDAPLDLTVASAILEAREVPCIEIAGRKIGPGQPCFIIAEAGVNHNGNLELALKLVDAAAAAGADAVKFQTFKADRLVTKDAPKAGYQIRATGDAGTQYEMLKHLELTEEDHRALIAHCERRGVLFLSTPFDEESCDFLESLGLPAFKLPSGELTNLPFLAHVAGKGKPVILSTGMATLQEVDAAVETFARSGNNRLVLLQCVSEYPADPAEANLRAMASMRSLFGFPVGFSDHTPGMAAAITAAALGACVVEKHFTLDRELPGPDHRASLEPEELAGDGARDPSRRIGPRGRREAPRGRRGGNRPGGAQESRGGLRHFRRYGSRARAHCGQAAWHRHLPRHAGAPARAEDEGRRTRRHAVRLGDARVRTIGIVTTSRADYGIYLPLLRRIQAEPGLALRLLVTGMHLSPRFGMTVKAIEADGFEIAERVKMLSNSDDPAAIAKSMARGTAGFAEVFSRSRPDILVVLGDRFEMHAAALAALPFKIPVAHIHGGELTEGAIDDALRHSMTKLSHLHFAATQEYGRRLVQMGEEPWRVTVSGAPSLDNLASVKRLTAAALRVPLRAARHAGNAPRHVPPRDAGVRGCGASGRGTPGGPQGLGAAGRLHDAQRGYRRPGHP